MKEIMLFILGIIAWFYKVLVFQIIWNWFHYLFGLPAITYIQALVVLFVIDFVLMDSAKAAHIMVHEMPKEDIVRVFISFFWPTLALIVAWVIRFFV